MRTDPAHGGREGIIFLDHLKCFLVSPSFDQSYIALGTCLGRTGILARAGSSFCHQESIRNCLRIRAVNRFPFIQAFIEFIREMNGTNIDTVVATRTLLQIDVARPFADLGPKTARLSLERKQLGVWNDFDVEMAAHLNQFRGEDTHRTVIGGKGLVELCHDPTNGR
jgi:hypothetical protein